MERLEETYKTASVVEQVWVYGNSFESALVAVVVPDKAALLQWASKASVQGSYEQICSSVKAEQHVLHHLASTGRATNLKVGIVHIQQWHCTGAILFIALLALRLSVAASRGPCGIVVCANIGVSFPSAPSSCD